MIFKTGITPSPMAKYDFKSLTATQRLSFVRCRIWHTFLNSGLPTGIRDMKRNNPYKYKLDFCQFNLHEVTLKDREECSIFYEYARK
jgi:hypothetical protein